MEQTVFRKYEERNFTVTKYDLYIDPKRTEIRCSPDGVIYLLTYWSFPLRFPLIVGYYLKAIIKMPNILK